MSRKRSPHALAELRRLCDLKQRSLAELVGRSFRTIQEVECLNRPLSSGLALQVSEATRVSVDWLLANDLNVPCTNIDGQKYSKEDLDRAQSEQSEWKTYTAMERDWALRSRANLLWQYLVARNLLHRLPDRPDVRLDFSQYFRKAVLDFIENNAVAKRYWAKKRAGELFRDVKLDGPAIRSIANDLSQIRDHRQPELSDDATEKGYVEFLWHACRDQVERRKAVTFIRKLIRDRGEETVDQMLLVDIRELFMRTLSRESTLSKRRSRSASANGQNRS
jgi:transcriptional regulator with XRE-family HTH domain